MDLREIDAIGRTSFEVAALRAAEDRRPDRLFADPHAAAFLDAAGLTGAPSGAKADFVAIMGVQAAVRTRFLDEALLTAVSEGCRQVVLVASGMDSRPWRLDWPPDVRLFEVDQPSVLRFKENVIGTRPARTAVPADLRTNWTEALVRSGFDPALRTAWLVEGLLYALDEHAADRLLDALTAVSAPGSSVAFDHVENSAALTEALTAMDVQLVDLWQSGPADPAEWLRNHGWRADLHELSTVAREWGRRAHPAYDEAEGGGAHAWLGRAAMAERQASVAGG